MFGSFIYDSQDDEMKWTIICICSDNLDNLNLEPDNLSLDQEMSVKLTQGSY
jgi:hypothetical protein